MKPTTIRKRLRRQSKIIEHGVVGIRSAVTRLRRRGTKLEFVVFPMLHVAMPSFYDDITERLRQCDLLVVEGIVPESNHDEAKGREGSGGGSLAVSALTAIKD